MNEKNRNDYVQRQKRINNGKKLCLFKCILKVGVEESIVNAPRITAV
jgi:hypothetical protein